MGKAKVALSLSSVEHSFLYGCCRVLEENTVSNLHDTVGLPALSGVHPDGPLALHLAKVTISSPGKGNDVELI